MKTFLVYFERTYHSRQGLLAEVSGNQVRGKCLTLRKLNALKFSSFSSHLHLGFTILA